MKQNKERGMKETKKECKKERKKKERRGTEEDTAHSSYNRPGYHPKNRTKKRACIDLPR